MRIEQAGQILLVGGMAELSALNAQHFREEICAALPESLDAIEIDLAGTQFIDSCGLGALVSVQRAASRHNGGVPVRLLNPTPAVQQVFELTRMHLLFEITRRTEPSPCALQLSHENDTAPVHLH